MKEDSEYMEQREDVDLVRLLGREYRRLKGLLLGALDHDLEYMVRFIKAEGFQELLVTYRKVAGPESLYPDLMSNLGDVLKAYDRLEVLQSRLETFSRQVLKDVFTTIISNPQAILEIKSVQSKSSLIITFEKATQIEKSISLGKC